MKRLSQFLIIFSILFSLLQQTIAQDLLQDTYKNRRRQQHYIQEQYMQCGHTQQQISVLNNSKPASQRLLQTQVASHNFKIKIVSNQSSFKYDRSKILKSSQIIAKYFQNVIFVTPLPSQSTFFPSNSSLCGNYLVESTYKTVGFNTQQIDMVTFVTAYYASESTYIKNSLCVLSRWPTYGSLIFNEYKVNNRNSSQYDYYHYIMYHVLHQFVHILGFNSDLFTKFYTSYNSGVFKDISQVVVKYNQTYAMVITPSVINYVQQYFGCNKEIGAFLQNYGTSNGISSHWQGTLFITELMSAITASNPDYISELTLSLLKDTNYYHKVDVKLANKIFFGKNKGCEFATGFVNAPQYPQASTYINQNANSPEMDFGGYYAFSNLFSNQSYVTILPNAVNYCCFRSSDNYWFYGEHFGHNSFSAIVDQIPFGPYPYCVQYNCLSDGKTVLINFDTYNFTCTSAEQTYTIANLGTFICPSNVRNVCQRKMCVDFCFFNGYCVNQTCYMLDCSNITNCSTCTTDYASTLHCQSCTHGYFPSSTKLTCLACSQLAGCQNCGAVLGRPACFSCSSSSDYPLYVNDSFLGCFECSKVIANCVECSIQIGQTLCENCSNGTYKFFDKSQCGQCETIILNCKQCIDDGDGFPFCVFCEGSLFPIITDNSECLPCNQCIIFCTTCNNNNGNATCLQCQSNKYLQNDEKNECRLCDTYIAYCFNCIFGNQVRKCLNCTVSLFPALDQLSCRSCGNIIENCTLCLNNNGVTECLACNNDSFVDANKHCSLCNSNCKTCLGNSKNCTACPDKDNQFISTIGTCLNIPFIYPGFTGTCQVNKLKKLCPIGCKICQCYGQNGNVCRQANNGYIILNKMVVQCPQNCLNCQQTNNTLACSTCQEGYSLIDGLCQKCQQSCFSCNSSNLQQCTSCSEGTYLNYNNICSPCAVDNCKQCNHPKFCSKCYSGYYLNDDFDQCLECLTGCSICSPRNYTLCIGCGSGFFFFNNLCFPCSNHCKICESASNCTICSQGYILNNKTAKCQIFCSFPCFNCSQDNPKKCTSCLAGYTYNSSLNNCIPQTDCNPCQVCPFGYQLFNKKCRKCQMSHAITCNSTSNIVDCERGYFAKDYACQACINGCQICKDQDSCSYCTLGFTKRFSNNTQFKGGLCYACESPCKTCYSNVSNCLSCVQGYQINGWKCEYSNKIKFNTTLTADYNDFILNRGLKSFKEYIFTVVGRSFKNNSTVFTIESIKEGSTIIVGSLANYPQFNSKDCLLLAKMNQNLNHGTMISGYKIISIDLSSSVATEPCPQIKTQDLSFNSTLVIVIVVVGVLTLIIVFVVIFLIVRRVIKKRNEISINHQPLQINQNQIIENDLSQIHDQKSKNEEQCNDEQ